MHEGTLRPRAFDGVAAESSISNMPDELTGVDHHHASPVDEDELILADTPGRRFWVGPRAHVSESSHAWEETYGFGPSLA